MMLEIYFEAILLGGNLRYHCNGKKLQRLESSKDFSWTLWLSSEKAALVIDKKNMKKNRITLKDSCASCKAATVARNQWFYKSE